MTTTIDQVRQIAADVFGEPLSVITAETSPKNMPAWDSLQNLNLMLALEETFQLQFSPEEAEQMVDIAAVAAMVERKSA